MKSTGTLFGRAGFGLAALFLAAALGAGCGIVGSRLTPENCAKIHDDMTLEEVSAILGTPTDNKSLGMGPLTATTVTWEDESYRINVKFLNNKSGLKSCTTKEAKEAGKTGG